MDNKLGLNLDQVDQLVNSRKDAVWVIEIEAKNKLTKFLTGICVDSRGFVLTSFFEEENHNLRLRNYDNIVIEGENIEVVKRKKNWGFSLLQIKLLMEFICVQLAARNRMPIDGQSVLAIGHCGELEYSVPHGYVAYSCNEDVFVPVYSDESCIDTDFDPEHYYNIAKCAWRIAGFCHSEGAECGSLQLELPLIEIHKLPCAEQFLGAPVFDANGFMVGLIIFNWLSTTYALPAAALEKILSEEISDGKKNEATSFQEMQQWQPKQ